MEERQLPTLKLIPMGDHTSERRERERVVRSEATKMEVILFDRREKVLYLPIQKLIDLLIKQTLSITYLFSPTHRTKQEVWETYDRDSN